MLRRPCVLAFVCLAAMVAHVRAQATDSPGARPGVAQNGRSFGFVPKHQRILQQRNVQMPQAEIPTTSTELATRPPKPKTKNSDIQQASYAETITADGEFIVDSPCECVGPCQGTCKSLKLWGGAEYLHWWTNGVTTPALATTSPSGTLQTNAGVPA